MVISKQEMQSRLGWFSTKVESQIKQEGETTDTIKEVEKTHEVVLIHNTQENQPGDALTSVDTIKVTDTIKDDYGEINKEQENIREKREVEQLIATGVVRDIKGTEDET